MHELQLIFIMNSKSREACLLAIGEFASKLHAIYMLYFTIVIFAKLKPASVKIDYS